MIRDRWNRLVTNSSGFSLYIILSCNLHISRQGFLEVKRFWRKSRRSQTFAIGASESGGFMLSRRGVHYMSLFLGFIHRSWVLPLSSANHLAFVVRRCSRISSCRGTCCVGELPFFLFSFSCFSIYWHLWTVVTSPQSSQSRLWLFLCNFPYIIPSDRRREFLWILTYQVLPNHLKG